MKNKEEIKLIEQQIIFSLISIGAIIISIVLLQNQKRYLQKKVPFFTTKGTKKISTINRIILLLIAIGFLYINYRLKEISKVEGEDLTSYNLQIFASYLTIIASIIALYVILTSVTDGVSDIENPVI